MTRHASTPALVLLIGVITSLSCVTTVAASYEAISDDESERVTTTFACREDRQCAVSRVIVQRPHYDGPPGYTAILVTSEQVPGPGVWREELTVFVRGQYRLLGIDPERRRVFCYKTAQRGAYGAIVNLTAFDEAHVKGEIIGPEGVYQYVSCGDNGQYCVLVDSGVTIVDMNDGTSRRIAGPDRIPTDAADRPHDAERGYWIGAGYSTSGEFVEMLWDDSSSGTLLIRNKSGEPTMKIAVDWKAGG